MNIPFKKEEVNAFKNDSKLRFMSSGSALNRKKRREGIQKSINKPRMVIYTDPKNGLQHKSIEYYQVIGMPDGSDKKIQHFK